MHLVLQRCAFAPPVGTVAPMTVIPARNAIQEDTLKILSRRSAQHARPGTSPTKAQSRMMCVRHAFLENIRIPLLGHFVAKNALSGTHNAQQLRFLARRASSEDTATRLISAIAKPAAKEHFKTKARHETARNVHAERTAEKRQPPIPPETAWHALQERTRLPKGSPIARSAKIASAGAGAIRWAPRKIPIARAAGPDDTTKSKALPRERRVPRAILVDLGR